MAAEPQDDRIHGAGWRLLDDFVPGSLVRSFGQSCRTGSSHAEPLTQTHLSLYNDMYPLSCTIRRAASDQALTGCLSQAEHRDCEHDRAVCNPTVGREPSGGRHRGCGHLVSGGRACRGQLLRDDPRHCCLPGDLLIARAVVVFCVVRGYTHIIIRQCHCAIETWEASSSVRLSNAHS